VAPLPNANPAAGIAFYALLAIFGVLEQRIRLRSWLNRQGSREDRGSLLVVIVCVSAGLVGGLFAAADVQWAAIPVARWPIFIVGLVLMCAGIVIRQWAIVLLGNFFTVDVRVHPGQLVIDRGPYAWVRHPSYTGMIMTFVGVGLALGNVAALAALVVLPTVGLVFRIRSEERALLAGLGEPYRQFSATRARLVPGLW
jgi:protein-S-isoprenylcysteine O-methyltransferase Ste14